MASTLLHFARWLAWQLGEHEQPLNQPPARITLISANADE